MSKFLNLERRQQRGR
ncbi:hypothetical protein F383_39344 [Gossypium arboreum]|nr:hypothetical protein F383_39344 [Gossypium arboreum]